MIDDVANLAAGQDGTMRRSAFTLLELLVAIGIIAVLLAILLPVIETVRHRGYRARCQGNLHQIGELLAIYAGDNAGEYPRTRYVADAPLVAGTGAAAGDPFAVGGPSPNDTTAGLYLLIRATRADPAVVICPYNDVRAYVPQQGDVLAHANFSDWKLNLGYSYANAYPSGLAAAAGYRLAARCPAGLAIAADANPGNTRPGDDALAAYAGAPSEAMKSANSPNHEKEGQNVLFGDSHVQWEQNPLCGVDGDNIYTSGSHAIVASPVDGNDSVLLPADW